MVSILPIFSIFPAISAAICAFILIYTMLKGEKSSKLLSFELMIACPFIWSVGQFLEYSTYDLILVSYYTKILHTAIAFVGTFCFIFSLYYTENVFVYKYKKALPLFFIVPVFVFLMIMTNEFHGLYYTIYPEPESILKRGVHLGPLFWFIFSYTIVFTFISMSVIIKSAIQNTGKIRKQMIFIVLVMLIPFVINIAEVSISVIIHWKGYPIDFTPTSFSFSCLFVFLATFRYNFLDVMPIALKIIFNHIEHATVVFNRSGKLIKYNLSFDKSFKDYIDGESDINTSEKLCRVLSQSMIGEGNIDALIDTTSESMADTRSEITLKSKKNGEIRMYETYIQSIFDAPKHSLGKIITFHDITRYKILVEEVNQKNHQLTGMNEKLIELNNQLNENMKLTEQLAISDERNRIARELHDSLGHTLMLVIMLMKAGKIECGTNSDNTKDKLAEAINIAEDGFRELRRLINGFLSDDIKNRNIIHNLENLFGDVRNLGVRINFSVIGEEHFNNLEDSDKTIKITDTVYKICKEALTNSIRHGKATHVNVILKYTSESVNIYVIDNGTGCNQIKEGLGLIGMKQRVEGVHGKIVYGSDGESGFNIHAQLPIGGKNDKSVDCG